MDEGDDTRAAVIAVRESPLNGERVVSVAGAAIIRPDL
jgi:hypothetical protein